MRKKSILNKKKKQNLSIQQGNDGSILTVREVFFHIRSTAVEQTGTSSDLPGSVKGQQTLLEQQRGTAGQAYPEACAESRYFYLLAF